MNMKYIRLEDAGFIVFEGGTKHSTMARKFPNDKVISAGFVNSTAEKETTSCHGESQSLGIKSDAYDSDDLERRLSYYG